MTTSRTSTLRTARSALLALALSSLLAAGFAMPTWADDKGDVKRQQRENAQNLENAQDEVQHSTQAALKARKALQRAEQRLSSAQGELGRTRGKLAVAQAEDERLRGELDRAQAELTAAEQRLDSAEKKLKGSRGAVEQFAVEQVMAGDSGLRAFGDLMRGADPAEFSEQMSINTSVGDAQLSVMQQLAASEVMLGIERDKVEDLRDQVAEQKKQAEAVVVTMQALTAQAEAQAASVAQLVTARTSAKRDADSTLADDLARQRDLEAKRAELERQVAEIVRRELEAAERARKARERKKGGGGSDDEPDNGGGTTGDGGGTLSRPVNAPITSPYGMRWHPITGVYKLHDGTDFGAACGTPIRAAAGGTIVSQYYNGAYGNRIILNNGVKRGVSVITTYNHLSRFRLSSGTKVSRGQVIGYVGTTGYSTGCHLHFMVLANGSTTNPMNWL